MISKMTSFYEEYARFEKTNAQERHSLIAFAQVSAGFFPFETHLTSLATVALVIFVS